ncbi:MAG TPA: hypothetical protein VFK58_04550 [Sphingomicrobium sp.]|nr:hypothetical protein [Sphingomicrobium sp.]
MARNNRGGRNNNPEGRNQYSSGWMDTARDRPLAAAATAAAAVGAGVFLWSRRNQISEQLSHLSDQISEWSEGMRSSSGDTEFETGTAQEQSFMARPSRRGGRKSQSAIAEEALTLKETGTADTNTRV